MPERLSSDCGAPGFAWPHDPARARVVILGAGFGGLEAAKALARAPVEITLVDRENHHCFQPLLYQVATAALSPADVAWPVRSILSRQNNIRVVMAEVTGVDAGARRVFTDATPPLTYDFLVIATGAAHSYFGHDEWAPFAPGLKRIEDATEIRRRLLLAFERAEIAQDARDQQRLLTFVIVGGGPTGVELAGAVAELARHALARDFRCIDPRSARILLVEAGPRLLPALPEDLSRYAEEALTRMGVQVRLSTMVTACGRNGIETASGEHIDGETVIWAAGVEASPAGCWLGADRDRAGRVRVAPDLSVPAHPEIFVIGDAAAVLVNGRPVPGIAPAAKQMGRHVGRVVAARVVREKPPPAFRYRHYGDLATIGRKAAVVAFGRVHLTGFVAWVFWGVAHIFFLIGARNRLSVAFDWLWDYATFQRGARLINARGRAKRETVPEPEIDIRSVCDVIEDHLRLRCEGRLEEDLVRNYASDVVILTSWGPFRGHDGVRTLAEKMKKNAPDGNLKYRDVLVDGVFAFVQWQAAAQGDIRNGAESFLVRGGKIVAQSIHCDMRTAVDAEQGETKCTQEPAAHAPE